MSDEKEQKPVSGLDIEIESPEQSKITEHIGGKVSEIVQDVDYLDTGEDELGSGSFSEKLRRVFGMIGFTFKRFFGCLFILFAGGALIYFLFTGGLTKIRNFISTQKTQENIKKPEQKTPPRGSFFRQAGIQSSLLIGNLRGLQLRTLPSSIQNALRFGNEENFSDLFSVQQNIVETSLKFGFRGQPQEKLARYVNILGQVQSALNTDISAMLNATSHRRFVLDTHVRQLEYLLNISNEVSIFIASEMATTRLNHDVFTDAKKQAEIYFFQAVENFHGEQSTDLLQTFIVNSQQSVSLRSMNLALNKLRGLYLTAEAKLTARIRDVKNNREALIKGIQVYDIQNSDLNLILPDPETVLE